IYEGVRYSGVLGADDCDEYYLPGYTGSDNISVTNAGFNTYDNFELDFYIDDVDNFNTRVSKLYFVVKRDNNSVKYEFQDLITVSGWNHVKFPITWETGTDKWVLEGGYVRFYITKSASDVGAADRYSLGNICATKDMYNVVPDMPEAARIFEINNGVKYEGLLGSAALDQYYLPGYSSANIMSVSNPKFDTYDDFELDYYVDNIANFNARVSKMEFAVRSNSYGTKLYDFTDQITKSGWNHIKIAIEYNNDSEKSCLNSAYQVRIYITMSAGEQGAADRYRLANVCATAKEVTHIPGDINGDAELNNKDLTRLFQYLSDWNVEVNEYALDVNGDGDVNNKDLIRLFQYLSNWNVEIF
ncbi:MAG: dockerin type I repeat-containing protein, partial [Clostridia bacterium]|nr:dockerin type I repeat-containing protein [Clostridia bacterium]